VKTPLALHTMSDWRSRSLGWFQNSGALNNKEHALQTFKDYLEWDEFSTLRLHESITVQFNEEGSLGIKIGVEHGHDAGAATIHYIQGLNNSDDQGNARQLDALAQLRFGDVVTHVNGQSIVQMDTPSVLGVLKNPARPMKITVMRHNSEFHQAVENGDKGYAEDVVVVRKDVARYVPTTVSPEDLRDLVFFDAGKYGSRSHGDLDTSTTDDDASTTDEDLQSLPSPRKTRKKKHNSNDLELLSDSESCGSSDSSASASSSDDDDVADALGGGPSVDALEREHPSPSSASNGDSYNAKTVRRVQRKLTSVLLALTRRLQQSSGYAQGMHSIVALFLGAGLSEEKAFWLMVTIVENLCERGFYASNAGSRAGAVGNSMSGLPSVRKPGARRDSCSVPSEKHPDAKPRKSRATSAYHDISVMLQETEVAIQLLKRTWPILQEPHPTESSKKSPRLRRRGSKSGQPEPTSPYSPAGALAATEGIQMISPSVLIPLFVGSVPLAVTLAIWDDLFHAQRDSSGKLIGGGSVTLLQAFVTILDMQYKDFEAICTSRRPESTRVYAMLAANLSQIDPHEFLSKFEINKATLTADIIDQCRVEARKILTLQAERRRRTVRMQNVMVQFGDWAADYTKAAKQYKREFGGYLSHLSDAQEDKAQSFKVLWNGVRVLETVQRRAACERGLLFLTRARFAFVFRPCREVPLLAWGWVAMELEQIRHFPWWRQSCKSLVEVP